MKTMALIGLILMATVSTGVAADTLMTTQTNTAVRIDPITGQVKGDAQTQVEGVRKALEAPQAVNTSPGGPSSANTGAATAPVTATTPTDPNAVATPVSVAAPTDQNTVTTPPGAAPPTSPDRTSPFQPVLVGQQN